MLCFFFFHSDRVSTKPWCPGAYSVDQAHPPASNPQVLRFKQRVHFIWLYVKLSKHLHSQIHNVREVIQGSLYHVLNEADLNRGSVPEEINFANCFNEPSSSCFPWYVLFASGSRSWLLLSSFPGDAMRTVRGLECDNRVLEVTGFFLSGNAEFSCSRKSRPSPLPTDSSPLDYNIVSD
ncbi:hypothetical protein LEMLEM_LOCUS826 [Lemmus lemmus]